MFCEQLSLTRKTKQVKINYRPENICLPVTTSYETCYLGLWYKKDVQPSTWSIKTRLPMFITSFVGISKKSTMYTLRYDEAIYWFYYENISSKPFYIVALTFWIRKIELLIRKLDLIFLAHIKQTDFLSFI